MPALPISPSLRRLASSPWSEVTLAVVTTVAQMAPLLFEHSDSGRPWHWWGYVVAVGASLPLAVRRRAPASVLLVCAAFAGLYDLAAPLAPQPLWYGTLIALHGMASVSPPRVRIPVFLAICACGLASVGSPDTATRGVVLYVAAYALGRASAGSRAEAAALAERAARLERERQVDEERAAERERARIAREMHDVLAHSISLMVVQAEAGPVVLDTDPTRASAAFGAIAGTGRDALEQLRRMLAVLKDEDDPRAPQPTIHDLPALVRQVAGAGLEVFSIAEGEPRPVPADCGAAAYRIVQEALTNVVKHAGAERAEVRLRWCDDGLEIRVIDDGRGAGKGLPSGGNGLIGLRERAAACGGTATTGPREDRLPGFEVRARLPLAAPEVRVVA
ncbi:sensor histidine kinase [Streptomyces chattanoogensis]|uniref:histidine kinase n=1 Tax=Streptomyces chattanoogensis TaxID=66876 RepID=A0A0N0H2B7_9ACTN|nr:histidine kinase [Streptomyces chattanoogensis]KPC65232.1 histidine kinase [Streptomyces chattanoogensis]